MTRTQRLISFLLLVCLGNTLLSGAKTTGRFPDPTDAKAVIAEYINAIGGLEAVKKVSSMKDTGSFSVQGMTLPMVQKAMTPNKMMQLVNMNGMTVSKTVFNGVKGYTEQMGNHMDMGDTELADQKAHAFIIPQADYLTGDAFKLLLQGTEKVGDADAYKVQVTMPSGAVSTEYYDIASHLLVKQVLVKEVSGQSVTITYGFGDYRKVGNIMMPYKESLGVASGAINQSIDITIADVKINEGVSEADFE